LIFRVGKELNSPPLLHETTCTLSSPPLPPPPYHLFVLSQEREREREKGIPKKSKYGVISKNAVVVVCCKLRKENFRVAWILSLVVCLCKWDAYENL
jgi:hypothetical protein